MSPDNIAILTSHMITSTALFNISLTARALLGNLRNQVPTCDLLRHFDLPVCTVLVLITRLSTMPRYVVLGTMSLLARYAPELGSVCRLDLA
jgi:hypothetical protein